MSLSRLLLAVAAVLLLSGCSFSVADILRHGATATGRDRVERAIAHNPRNAHAWFTLARMDLERGDYKAARLAFRRALAANPAFEEAELGIALTYLNQKRWRDAARAYDALLAKSPGLVPAWEGLAAARLGALLLDEAEVAAERALALEPNARQAHRVLAEVAYLRADYAAVLRHWDNAGMAGASGDGLSSLANDLATYVSKYHQPPASPAP